MYIYRELYNKIITYLKVDVPRGLILSGIVGCGKTTLVEKIIADLANFFEVFSFTGDDSQFRNQIATNSKYLMEHIHSRTSKRALLFVDEVQKSEEIFDALKIAFDQGKVSFIVSGSNPAYLSTVAKNRLQRRADQFLMLPISLMELAIHHQVIETSQCRMFIDILWNLEKLSELVIPPVTINPLFQNVIHQYFTFGGLPLALQGSTPEEKLREIRLTTERGFDLMSVDNNTLADTVRNELAQLHSTEFTYKNIMEKTRTRRRENINEVIDLLVNHGYLVKKQPLLLTAGKTSYLSVFSFVDPGIVTYLKGQVKDLNIGAQVEGYVHARLAALKYNVVFKSNFGYYKPHTLDDTGKVRYHPGEIDFIFECGKRLIPIEVKATGSLSDIDCSLMKEFVKNREVPFGIVLYGGAPNIHQKDRILFWPHWMV